jgi:hypothetical protein
LSGDKVFTTVDSYQIEEYIKTHPTVFEDFEKNYILWFSKSLERRAEVPYYVLELFDELGILPDDENVYEDFFNFIKSIHSLDNKRIIEVAGGMLPRLSFRIRNNQDGGRVTVYDPRLASHLESDESFILKRENFNTNIDSSNTDLIIGLKPCEATEDIIRWATSNHVDFIIGLCEGGLHGEPYDYFESSEDWIRSMVYLADRLVESENMGELKIKKLRDCNYNYPIIYNSRNE